MNLRNKSKSRAREEVIIDLTPMVDVVFLLIIFFLITTTFQKERTINLDLAKSNSSKEFKKNNGITISINKEGKYFYLKKEVTLDKLKDILQNENKKELILIKSDKDTAYKFVVDIMSLLQDLDLTNLDFITK